MLSDKRLNKGLNNPFDFLSIIYSVAWSFFNVLHAG